MLTITKRLPVDPGGIPVIVHLSQYDSDFTLVFELFSISDFTIPSGTTAEIRGTKSDGNGYSADATVDASAKTVTVAGDNQITAASGKNVFEIALLKDGELLNTANFTVCVERAALDADTIQSETVLKDLDAIIEGAATATEAAQEAAASAAAAAESASTLTIDPTLTHSGQPADAKVTGDEISDLKSAISEIEPGLSDNAKVALLNCFQHVAFLDDDADYYGSLESALYADQYPKITAVFNPGANVIYTDDTLDSLKQYLTVKYYETEESTGTVIASANYSLSGSLVEGESTMFVSYSGLTTSFVIDGVVDYYNIWNWSMANGDFSVRSGSIDYFGNVSNVRYTFRSPYDTRRGVTAPKGLLPYRVWGTDTDMTSYYPIPIPKDANKVTISITPNTQYIYMQVMHVSNGNVTRIAEKGWTQGTTEVTFNKDENNVVFFNTKYDSAGTSYPVDPTEITIAFEEV